MTTRVFQVKATLQSFMSRDDNLSFHCARFYNFSVQDMPDIGKELVASNLFAIATRCIDNQAYFEDISNFKKMTNETFIADSGIVRRRFIQTCFVTIPVVVSNTKLSNYVEGVWYELDWMRNMMKWSVSMLAASMGLRQIYFSSSMVEAFHTRGVMEAGWHVHGGCTQFLFACIVYLWLPFRNPWDLACIDDYVDSMSVEDRYVGICFRDLIRFCKHEQSRFMNSKQVWDHVRYNMTTLYMHGGRLFPHFRNSYHKFDDYLHQINNSILLYTPFIHCNGLRVHGLLSVYCADGR